MSRPGDFWKSLSIALAVAGAALAPTGAAVAATLTNLYDFNLFSGDGRSPSGPLAFDGAGALYGTTSNGGAHGLWGTVFKLTPPGDPSAPWPGSVLYSFTGGPDGGQPRSGVIFDRAGNLYGTTLVGATDAVGCGLYARRGCGTVFEGFPPATPDGAWGGRLLHTFTGTPDGGNPGGLFLDPATGIIYGTTETGGLPSDNCVAGYCGTVFSLTPPANPADPWTYSVIWQFPGGADGGNPSQSARLVMDVSGALHGTTQRGGADGVGTLFQLTPGPAGYSLTTLWSFRGRTAIMTAIGFERAGPILKPLEQWRNSILRGNRRG